MKTIEELANLGAKAALKFLTDGSDSMSVGNEVLPDCWEDDQPAREAFARAVRDEVLREQFLDEQKPTIDQPAADVPTWRPIAEFPERPHDDEEYVYWDGDMSWHGNFTEKQDATHFITHPPKPDPFEVWYAQWLHDLDRHTARTVWNAAREANP